MQLFLRGGDLGKERSFYFPPPSLFLFGTLFFCESREEREGTNGLGRNKIKSKDRGGGRKEKVFECLCW